MRIRLLLATVMLAAPAGAVTIVHSTTVDPYNLVCSTAEGDCLHYESSYDYYVAGLNTVRLDVQGGTLDSSRVSLSWSDIISVKTNGGIQTHGQRSA